MRFKDRAITIALLLFTSLICIYNTILYAKFWYIAFVAPFVTSLLEHDRRARIYELVGIYLCSFYILIKCDITYGIMTLIIANTFLYSYNKYNKVTRLVSYLLGIVVFIVSARIYQRESMIMLHAFIDSFLYLVGSICMYLLVHRTIQENKAPDKPLDKKYIETLEQLRNLAHESIDLLRDMQRGKK